MAHLEKEALAAAWLDFKATGDREIRNDLVLHYQSLVRYVASRIASGLPAMVEKDDLTSYGMFGLMDAIEKYGLDRGVKFETYAVTRIKGAILDELRALDWVPRTVRSKARDVEKGTVELQDALGRPPEDAELATYLGIPIAELWLIQNQKQAGYLKSLDEPWEDGGQAADGDGNGLKFQHSNASANPEDLYGTQEVAGLLATAIDAMPSRSKTILVLYYLQEMTLAEIGEVLGVTESRVCQLQSKVLQSLREALGHGATAAA